MLHLHGHHEAVDDERRPEAGPQSEEEHPPAVVAAERLHRGVVDDLRRLAERGLEVEPDPARPEVDRLADDLPVDHGSRDADGDAYVLPVGRLLENAGDHLLGRELVAGREAPPLVEAVQYLLDVRAADVDREHGRGARLDRVLALLSARS